MRDLAEYYKQHHENMRNCFTQWQRNLDALVGDNHEEEFTKRMPDYSYTRKYGNKLLMDLENAAGIEHAPLNTNKKRKTE
jgi:hypothetical protein